MTTILPLSSTTASFPIDTREQAMEPFNQILQEVPAGHFYSVDNMRAFLKEYNARDLQRIYVDFCALRESTFKNADKEKDYIVTAGGPAVGKSTVLEQFLEGKRPEVSEASLSRAYIDPDRSCLQKMEKTYLLDLEQGKTSEEAYTKWRGASNFLSNVFLALALKEGYAIAHGSTMASPYAKYSLQAIMNNYGYKVTILHVTAPDEVRKASEAKRQENGVVQVTPIDFEEKQKIFLKLYEDYLNNAHQVFLYYRGEMGDAVCAASVKDVCIETFNKNAFQAIQNIHDRAKGEEGAFLKACQERAKKLI